MLTTTTHKHMQVVSSILALFAFWIDSLNISIGVCLAAMMLECFTGYSLMKMLPPSTNQTPNIVYCYSYTFLIGLAVLTFHVCLIFAQTVLPEDIELNFRWTTITEWLRKQWPFKSENFAFESFDPETLIDIDSTKSQSEDLMDIQSPHQTQQQHSINPNFIVDTSEDVNLDSKQNTLIEMDSLSQEKLSQSSSTSSNKSGDSSLANHIVGKQVEEPSTSAVTSIIQLDDDEQQLIEEDSSKDKPSKPIKAPKEKSAKKKEITHLEQELQTLRRIVFFVVVIIQFGVIVWFI